MNTAPIADAKPGHNRGPITPPHESDLLEDLKARYPNVKPKFDELLTSAATVPEEVTEENAGQVQDLLRSMADALRRWKADRTAEKGPWAKLADIAYAFFKDKEDKLGAAEKIVRAKHTRFLEAKEAEEVKRREVAAEADRKRADEARIAAEKAAEEKRLAEEAKAKAEEEEREALRRAELAKAKQAEAEAAAAAAAELAKKAEAERKAREKAEREKLTENLKQVRRHMKDAARLHDAGVTDETGQADIDQLDALVRPGGIIGVLASQVFGSSLLDHEEVLEVEKTRIALGNMRQALEERLGEKARRKRERERKAQEKLDAQAAAEREAKRKADNDAAAAAREARDIAEAEAKAARADATAAKKEAREASEDANEAHAEVKQAAKDEASANKGAEKLEARAGRAERNLENASSADLTRTRSELGTVGSLSGRWTYVVEDRNVLTAYFGPLGQYLAPDAMDAALHRYKMQNQGTWIETPTRTEVPGVFFENVPESRIR